MDPLKVFYGLRCSSELWEEDNLEAVNISVCSQQCLHPLFKSAAEKEQLRSESAVIVFMNASAAGTQHS